MIKTDDFIPNRPNHPIYAFLTQLLESPKPLDSAFIALMNAIDLKMLDDPDYAELEQNDFDRCESLICEIATILLDTPESAKIAELAQTLLTYPNPHDLLEMLNSLDLLDDAEIAQLAEITEICPIHMQSLEICIDDQIAECAHLHS